MEVSREEMLMKLGAARAKAPTAWRLVDIEMDEESPTFTYALNRKKLRACSPPRRALFAAHQSHRERSRTVVASTHIQLVTPWRQAFKNLKQDLAIRPVFHQDEHRIEAHIFIRIPRLLSAGHAPASAACPGAAGLRPRAALWRNSRRSR